MVMGLVMAGGFLVLHGRAPHLPGAKDRLTDINSARLAVSAMSRSLRTAMLPSQLDDNTSNVTAAFIQGGPTPVSFYADINNPVTLPTSGNTRYGPSQVTYTVAGGVLTQTVQPPNQHDVSDNNYQYCTPGTAGCVVYTTILARRSTPPTTKPLFVYYDATGTPLGALTASNLDDVDSIDIRVGDGLRHDVPDGHHIVHHQGLAARTTSRCCGSRTEAPDDAHCTGVCGAVPARDDGRGPGHGADGHHPGEHRRSGGRRLRHVDVQGRRRRNQDWNAALAAAQAGVDDYIA